ncbi:MAG: hypothetical protein Q8P67_29055 [archaeon]|nr:hypothetical protein [archaeon]
MAGEGSKTDASKEGRGMEINPKYSFFLLPHLNIFFEKDPPIQPFFFSSLPTTHHLVALDLVGVGPGAHLFFSSSKSKKNQHF